MTTGVHANELRYLDPAVLSRIGSMELKARTVVEGFLTGLHRSPFKGFSVEFAEYREYLPGDDIATIDWKVYARSDRHYVRKFEEETNLDCHLLLDISGSMGDRTSRYGGRSVSQLSALQDAASDFLKRQDLTLDPVGLAVFSSNAHVVNKLTHDAGVLNKSIKRLYANGGTNLGRGFDVATSASAATLFWLGRMIDRVDLRWYTVAACSGLILSMLVIAAAPTIAILVVGLYLARLTGQGLMIHISNTSMGRYFDADRGKAVSVAAMGQSLGEAVLPAIVVVLIVQIGWRGAWFAAAAVVPGALAVLVPWLMRVSGERHRPPPEPVRRRPTQHKFSWAQ